MRIVFDVSYIQHGRAGYGHNSESLLRALLASDTKNEYVLHGWSWSLDTEVIRSFKREGVSLKIARIPGQLKRAYWNTVRVPELSMLTGRFDLFHGAEPLIPPVGKSAAICTVHDLAYLRFPHLFTPGVKRWDAFARRSAGESRALIVPSSATRDDLQELFGVPAGKIIVVPPPPDPRFSIERGKDHDDILRGYGLPERYILFVGTIEPRKNIPVLIRAYEQLRVLNRDTPPLVIVGKTGWLAEPSLAAINSSPVRAFIHTPGYVHTNHLPELYRAAAAFVYPSLYEGFGMPVREAMASGVPVVTSANSSLQELAEGAARLVDPASADEISAALDSILRDGSLANRLRAAGLARAAEFTNERSVGSVLALYNRIGSGAR